MADVQYGSPLIQPTHAHNTGRTFRIPVLDTINACVFQKLEPLSPLWIVIVVADILT